MIVIPAIDLKDGRCVRLSQGRMDRESVYSEDPVAMARHWESKGAERLHVVDLNGAVTGRPVHGRLIVEIVRSVRVPVEVGGGIRDLETVEDYLSKGVRWVILGTVAFRNPDLVREACRCFPGRVMLSIDAKGERVAIEGWYEVVSLKTLEMTKQFEDVGLSALVLTDVERDGMGTGINWEMTRNLSEATSIPVIASGGISKTEEIASLRRLEARGVVGVIIGWALYTGKIDLEEAIRVAQD